MPFCKACGRRPPVSEPRCFPTHPTDTRTHEFVATLGRQPAKSSWSLDLRSDTVTHPTEEMRSAMAEAEVGDEQSFADPSVLQLEQFAAKLLNKEAALFVCSGVMGNLVSVMGHCVDRGSQVFVGDQSHSYLWEQGNVATLAGVHQRAIKNYPDGTICLKEMESMIIPGAELDDPHYAKQKLLVLETTHNRYGGQALPVEYIDTAGELCKKYGLKLHIDGARLFNACTKLNVEPARMVQAADSVSICLSKGLCAPVGGLVVGTREFVAEARRARKALGGAMRQSGVIAAPGIIALSKMRARLKEDQENAAWLAHELQKIPGIVLDPQLIRAQTNQVVANLDSTVLGVTGPELIKLWAREGVFVNSWTPTVLRFVCHNDAPFPALQEAVVRMRKVCDELLRKRAKSHL